MLCPACEQKMDAFTYHSRASKKVEGKEKEVLVPACEYSCDSCFGIWLWRKGEKLVKIQAPLNCSLDGNTLSGKKHLENRFFGEYATNFSDSNGLDETSNRTLMRRDEIKGSIIGYSDIKGNRVY
jgi:hypothetical protein